MTIESIMRIGPVIPVVIIEDIEHAVPLADDDQGQPRVVEEERGRGDCRG